LARNFSLPDKDVNGILCAFFRVSWCSIASVTGLFSFVAGFRKTICFFSHEKLKSLTPTLTCCGQNKNRTKDIKSVGEYRLILAARICAKGCVSTNEKRSKIYRRVIIVDKPVNI